MSLPRFFHPQLPLQGDIALDDSEVRHASNVLRLARGAEVVLFDGRGGEAQGVVAALDKRSVTVSITARTDCDRELARPLELLVALPKGDRQKTLVDGLVQLGVTRLTPLVCQRGVAQPTASALERLQRSVVESSKQCGRNQLLVISSPLTIQQAISQANSHAISQAQSHAISQAKSNANLQVNPPAASPADAANPAQPSELYCVAHPYGLRQSLRDLASLQAGHSTGAHIAVGPEGGFSEAEIEQWSQAGWPAVDLGPRILRIEVAALQLAAWWSSL